MGFLDRLLGKDNADRVRSPAASQLKGAWNYATGKPTCWRCSTEINSNTVIVRETTEVCIKCNTTVQRPR